MFCESCGKKVIDGAAFCPECGARVVTNEAAAPQPEASEIADKFNFDARFNCVTVPLIAPHFAVIV